MGKSKSKRKKRMIGYNQLGMLAISAIVMLFLGGLMVKSNNLEKRLAAYDAKAAALEEKIEDEKARTEEIDKLKEYMQTDAYAEEIARERLGLVKENEIVFKEKQ